MVETESAGDHFSLRMSAKWKVTASRVSTNRVSQSSGAASSCKGTGHTEADVAVQVDVRV